MASSATILVVEDEDAIRLALRDFLVKKGHTVVVASDGAGAIEQLLDHEIDVIVSDYRMSILGGHYWIRFLERFCPEKKIIIMSAYLDSDLDHPFPVVKKPFEFEDLSRRIDNLIDDRRGTCCLPRDRFRQSTGSGISFLCA